MQRHFAILLLLVVIPGYAIAQKEPQKPAAAPCHLSQEDYAVYAAVLEGLGRPEDPEEAWAGKEILVVDKTASSTLVDIKGRTDWGLRSNSQASPAEDTRTDFESKVHDECPVEAWSADPRAYSIVTQAELTQFFKGHGGGWEGFYKKHPKAAGVWQLSRPGYNPSGNEAELYLGHHCGGLCGTGHLILLTKENGRWKVKNRLMLWIS